MSAWSTRIRRRPVLIGALVLVAAIAAFAVPALLPGRSSSPSSSSAGGGAEVPQPTFGTDSKSGGAADLGSGAAPSTDGRTALTAVPGPAVIRTAEVTVQVTDLSQAVARAEALAVGGMVAQSTLQLGTAPDGTPLKAQLGSAQVVLRVPSQRLGYVLDQLVALGQPLSRSLTEQDVTSQLIDVSSRLATQRRSVERVRLLMSRAQTLGQVVAIESELAQREADLESLEAQLAGLRDQVDLATVTATFITGAPPVVVPATSGFGSGLRAGWKAFQTSVRFLLQVTGAVLPFAGVVALLAGLVWLWRRRSQRRRVHQPPATG